MSLYVYQPYPACRYHPTQPPIVVASEAEDAALGPGWVDAPSKLPTATPPTATPPPVPPVAPEPEGLEEPEEEPEEAEEAEGSPSTPKRPARARRSK